jgi:hypothetical protein
MNESKELYSQFKGTNDEVFHDIIWIIFCLFEIYSEYFVFKKNAEYDDHSTPKNKGGQKSLSQICSRPSDWSLLTLIIITNLTKPT